GVLMQPRNSVDQPIGPIQDQTFVANPPRKGGYTVAIEKPGPLIASIAPSQSTLVPPSFAPGTSISIYGNNLDGSTVTLRLNGQILALSNSSPSQLDAMIPDNIAAR